MTKIISIHTFPGEYTAIQYGADVKRANKVCGSCGVKVSDFLKKKLETGAITANKQKCDMCGEEKYCSAIRHYL